MICGGSVLEYSNRQVTCLLDSSQFEYTYVHAFSVFVCVLFSFV